MFRRGCTRNAPMLKRAADRLSDWLIERRIAELVADLKSASLDIEDAKREYALLYAELREAINLRSAGQVERLERARGLR